MIDFLYWAMVAAFVTHELNAVKRHEWRILPVLRTFPDELAGPLFIWAHIPLFLTIFWFSRRGAETPFALAFSMFAVVHVGLHWAFRKHPRNEFIGASAWGLILLTGALGASHLVATVWWSEF